MLVTNESKGKGAVILGTILQVAGFAVPIGNFVLGLYNGNLSPESMKKTAIAGGVIFVTGTAARIYGRIKHWYWNK